MVVITPIWLMDRYYHILKIHAFGKCDEVVNETLLQTVYGLNISLEHGRRDFVVFNT